MAVLGVIFLAVIALVVLLMLVLLLWSIPDINRYLRVRKM